MKDSEGITCLRFSRSLEVNSFMRSTNVEYEVAVGLNSSQMFTCAAESTAAAADLDGAVTPTRQAAQPTHSLHTTIGSVQLSDTRGGGGGGEDERAVPQDKLADATVKDGNEGRENE